jgi:hypothetical protein
MKVDPTGQHREVDPHDSLVYAVSRNKQEMVVLLNEYQSPEQRYSKRLRISYSI